jgi:peptide methionine sulfoxide reductase MsrB
MFAVLAMVLALQAPLPRTGGAFVRGTEDIMKPKLHGTSHRAVPPRIRWGCDRALADWCCCFNRHLAEPSGYFKTTKFLDELERGSPTVYYDSVTGNPLFVAPIGRSLEAFLQETAQHGWPSFRDDEVVWENVRVLSDGECVSLDGTHLGHLIPDESGSRYCINLVSVAGLPRRPVTEDSIRMALRGMR